MDIEEEGEIKDDEFIESKVPISAPIVLKASKKSKSSSSER